MCRENKNIFFIILVSLLLCVLAGALQAEEPDRWYLISPMELRSIETSLERLETDRQNWELQARGLKNKAGNLNNQLAEERKQYKTLEQLFNKYEADQLTLVSSKNGEIADLKQDIAVERLEKADYKLTSQARLIFIIALAGSWVVFIAIKVCRFFRVIK